MPSKPRTAAKAAQQLSVAPQVATSGDDVQGWDDYVAEAVGDVKPWRKRLPDGEIIEVGCPTTEQMDALSAAQRVGDSNGMLVAVAGPDVAAKLAPLVAGRPFVLLVRMVNDIMFHFGMDTAQLPQSSASSS